MFQNAVFGRRFNVLALTLAVSAGIAATVTAQSEQTKKPPHEITKVVIEKKNGTFTHRLNNIAPGAQLRLAVGTDDADAAAKTVKFVPPHEFVVVDVDESAKRSVPHLYPNVLQFGRDDNTDFNVESLWKLLLGRKITVCVEKKKSSETGSGGRSKDAAAANPEGANGSPADGQVKISGTFVGYGKEGDAPATLKILAGDKGRQLYDIPQDTVVSLDFGTAFDGEIGRAAALLVAGAMHGKRSFVIERTGDDGQPDVDEMSVTYSHAVEGDWKVRLQGTADKDFKKLDIQGWVWIRNETPYNWENVDVTLKTEKGTYLLDDVNLDSYRNRWWPLTFLDQKHPDDPDRGKESVKLDLDRRWTITVPEEAEAKDKALPCHDTYVVKNTSGFAIPGGSLTIRGPDEPKNGKLEAVEYFSIEEMPADKEKSEVFLSIPTADPHPGLVVKWTRAESDVDVAKIRGLSLSHYRGYESTFHFKRLKRSPEPLEVLIGTDVVCLHPENPPDSAKADGGDPGLKPPAPANGPATLKRVCLNLPAPAKETVRRRILKPPGKKGVLSIRYCPKKPQSSDVTTVSTGCLRSLSVFAVPEDVRRAVGAFLSARQTIDGIETEIGDLKRSIAELDTQRRAFLAEPQSQNRGPILRRLATQIQTKQRQLERKRDELAVERLRFDHVGRGLDVPRPPTAKAADAHNLGARITVENGKSHRRRFRHGLPGGPGVGCGTRVPEEAAKGSGPVSEGMREYHGRRPEEHPRTREPSHSRSQRDTDYEWGAEDRRKAKSVGESQPAGHRRL